MYKEQHENVLSDNRSECADEKVVEVVLVLKEEKWSLIKSGCCL